jgi:methylenetetrahydrofolate dehydrogenase (NADP+)/methenyltetrahydrofolate cyclohydrolase
LGIDSVPARTILGEPIAAEVRGAAAAEAARILGIRGRRPTLALVAAADEAARIYATRIAKDAANCGIDARVSELGAGADTREALALVRRLAADSETDAILLQTPLPKNVDGEAAAAEIPVAKDVDGASLASMGAAGLGRKVGFYPATAAAVLEIARRSGVKIEGARAVVIGRSAVVGRPAALGLLAMNATVTIAHSRTRDLAALAREAEILVAAVGKPALVAPDWVRPGSLVIDVGIHRITDAAQARALLGHDPERWRAFEAKGSAIVGDCHPRVTEAAGAWTPVPGGVGPLTSAILMKHVVDAAAANR